MEVIVAVDIGSSSVKCNAYKVGTVSEPDAAGDAATLASSPAPLTMIAQSAKLMRAVHPHSGKIVPMNQIFQATEECITNVLSTCEAIWGHDFSVVAVGFSSFTMNLIGVDVDGQPIGEDATISYACNTTEVVDEVERLKRDLGEEEQRLLYQKTGTPIHSAYAMPQLRVMYETETELCDRIHQWQPISNLCIARWTGQNVCGMPFSYCEASWTGLLNFRTCTYEPTALALLPSDACRRALPRSVCDVDESLASGLSPSYQAKWPQLSQACFFLGVGDGAVANIGSKCSVPGRIACTIGTSAAARVCVPLPILPAEQDFSFRVPNGLFCYRIDRYHVLLGGALTDGGSAVEWIRNLLHLNDPRDFDECVERIGEALEKAEEDAYANSKNKKPSLTTVPFLGGERSVGYRSGATGVMFGLTRETTATDLVQSCLEGITLRLGAIIERIQAVIPEENADAFKPQIIVSGKGLEVNRVWRQMIANCTGLDTILDKSTFGGTLRGVAVLVLSRITAEAPSCSFPVEPIGGEGTLLYSPQARSSAYWKHMSEQQESLITAVSPLFGQRKS